MHVFYSRKYRDIITLIHRIFKKPRPKDEAFLSFLTKKLRLNPRQLSLYQMAFTHSSYKHIDPISSDYERLEHIGDCVVDLIVAQYLYDRYPEYKVGELSHLKAQYVSRGTLYRLTKEIFEPEYYKLGANVEPSDRVCCDFYESLVGAIYLDRGLAQASAFVKRTLIDLFNSGKIRVDILSYKALFIRWTQKYKRTYTIHFVKQAKGQFLCTLVCGDHKTKGVDTSKKKAEEITMRLMCRKLKIAK